MEEKNDIEEETRKYTIELLMYNKIFLKNNKTQINEENNENNLFIDKQIINEEISIKYENFKNNNNEINIEKNYYFKINDLIKNLRKKGYPLMKSTKIYIHLKYIDDYLLIDDLNEKVYLSSLSSNNLIKLKLENDLDSRLIEPLKEKEITNKRKSLIKDVIKNLFIQRKLNNGFYNDDGKKKSYVLAQASNLIKLKKKTMDEHMTQIRIAYQNGFDFNEHKDEDISILRRFVKNVKKNNMNQKNIDIKEIEKKGLNLDEDDELI